MTVLLSRDVWGPCAGEEGTVSSEAICLQRQCLFPQGFLGTDDSWGTAAHSCPCHWSPSQEGWGVLAHNSPTLPPVRVIKLGIVQAWRRLPVLITRDKILSWCLLVKDTITWVCSHWPESCKPSVTSTRGVTPRWVRGPWDQTAVHSFGLVEKPQNPPTAVRHRFCKGLTKYTDTAQLDGTKQAPNPWLRDLLPALQKQTLMPCADRIQPGPLDATPAPWSQRTTCQ